MPYISCRELVSHSSEQMYNLVNDVSSYSEFLPGCVESQILESSSHQMIAMLEIAKAGIRKKFTTHNTLISNKSISMHLVDGPFKELVGAWNFTELSFNTCYIEFQLHFEFSSKSVEVMFGSFFKRFTSNIVKAFISHAKKTYQI